MDAYYKTLVFYVKLEDILVREENNEEPVMTENVKENIKEEPIDIKYERLQTEDLLKTHYVPDTSFDEFDIETKDVPTFSNIFDHLYMKTEDSPNLNTFNFNNLEEKTEDGPHLNSFEHDHCYLRGLVRVRKVKMESKIRPLFIAKDIFRSPVESFNGLMTRLEPNERDEILTESSARCRDKILARKMKLPFKVADIINSPVDSFNELLTRPGLSPEQIKVCHDIRRRGKNKVAARNFRKRKMDTIEELQSQVDQLEDKKQELMRAKEKLVIEREGWRHRLSHLEEAVMSRLGSSSHVLEVIARNL